MGTIECGTVFTVADLPMSAFKNEAEAGEWLFDNASAIRDALVTAGNDAIEMYLEIDGRNIDYDGGYFDSSTTIKVDPAMTLLRQIEKEHAFVDPFNVLLEAAGENGERLNSLFVTKKRHYSVQGNRIIAESIAASRR